MPSCALSGRDPLQGKNGFSTRKGFTVIELLMAIAVLAIATSLALPSYRALLQKRQVTSGAEQLGAFLSSAQLEAVRRNETVAVSYDFNDEGDWCIGMVAAADGCNCVIDADSKLPDPDANTCMIDGVARAFTPATLRIGTDNVETKGALSGINGADDGTFLIEPVRGMMADFTDAMSVQFLSRPEGLYALEVQVIPTGRVRICSPQGDKAVPGFESC